MRIDDALDAMPVVAILRGIRPDETVAVGEQLLDSGIAAIEVPLNSPEPLDSIGRLAAEFGDRAAIGAGTVLAAQDVAAVVRAGASFIVAPDTRPSVIRAAREAGLDPVPGFATPSEALRALRAGARHLKLFPAASVGMGFVGAVRAVLPPDVPIIAVGGIEATNARQWLTAGAAGLGTGSSLYRAGSSVTDVGRAATELVRAITTRR